MTPTQAKLRLFGAWCGPAYLCLLFVGWGAFAGFLPPVAPSVPPTKSRTSSRATPMASASAWCW